MPESRPTEFSNSFRARFGKHLPMARVPFVVGAYVAYVVLFLILYVKAGPAVAMLAMLPVAMVGWLFGMRGGILGGLFCFPLNLLLLTLVGLSGWHEMTGTGGGMLGIIL